MSLLVLEDVNRQAGTAAKLAEQTTACENLQLTFTEIYISLTEYSWEKSSGLLFLCPSPLNRSEYFLFLVTGTTSSLCVGLGRGGRRANKPRSSPQTSQSWRSPEPSSRPLASDKQNPPPLLSSTKPSLLRRPRGFLPPALPPHSSPTPATHTPPLRLQNPDGVRGRTANLDLPLGTRGHPGGCRGRHPAAARRRASRRGRWRSPPATRDSRSTSRRGAARRRPRAGPGS
jgi:hypothetical protein